MKFGGSCLDKPNDLRRMVSLVKAAEQERPKLVLSAFKGITDELLNQAISAKNDNFDIKNIESKHQQLLEELPSTVRPRLEKRLDQLLEELRNTLLGVTYLRELTPATLDRIVSYGERLAIHTAAGYMTEAGLDSVPLSDVDAGILTDSNFSNACILDESHPLIREKIAGTHVPLIAGFFGRDKAGRITTLGRGGSDYVATLLASVLGCKCVLFKDVKGVMTADPKIVEDAKLIAEMDYLTAIELGRYGSRVVFEKVVGPAMKAGIPIQVTSFLDPSKGTLISNRGEAEAISAIRNVSMIRLLRLPNLSAIASILGELAAERAVDPLILAEVFRNEISIVTPDTQIERVSQIAKKMGEETLIKVEGNLALIAAIGKRFTASQVHETLQREKVEASAVVPGPSGITTCAIVNMQDSERSVKLLHDALGFSPRILRSSDHA
jgi:aspartate kinase